MTEALGLGARVACVFALLALVLWVLKRTDGLGARRRSTPVQVLSTTRLGKAATLSVVRVHDEEHVLAVTGSAVTVVSTRPAALAELAPAEVTGAAEPAPAVPPGPPSAAAFLRGGWQVLRQQPVAATELADDEVSAALRQACSPTRGVAGPAAGPQDGAATADLDPGTFAADLAAALEAVEPAAAAGVPTPRTAGELGGGHAPRRRRREVRPPHLRAPRRTALRPVEEAGA